MIESVLAGFFAGILGGFLAKNTAVLVKDQLLSRKVKQLGEDVDDFTSRITQRMNNLARSVKNALDYVDDPDFKPDAAAGGVDIPPELEGFAASYGVDLQAVFSGDAGEIKKLQALLTKIPGKTSPPDGM